MYDLELVVHSVELDGVRVLLLRMAPNDGVRVLRLSIVACTSSFCASCACSFCTSRPLVNARTGVAVAPASWRAEHRALRDVHGAFTFSTSTCSTCQSATETDRIYSMP